MLCDLVWFTRFFGLGLCYGFIDFEFVLVTFAVWV